MYTFPVRSDGIILYNTVTYFLLCSILMYVGHHSMLEHIA